MIFLRLLSALVFLLIAIPAIAEEQIFGDLSFDGATIKLPPAGAPVSAGYVTISNLGSKPVRLVGAKAKFAGRVEIHEMKMAEGVMKMRPLPNGIEIPPGKNVELAPGGYHLMFMKLEDTLHEGEPEPIVLQFDGLDDVTVEFVPRAAHSH